ncbi:hypothetical protein BS17DRAFT_784666 [Gyrodon lividus]|nr:hypothetical protein BS17DRAFT_784666 [Gyrodon lividus]
MDSFTSLESITSFEALPHHESAYSSSLLDSDVPSVPIEYDHDSGSGSGFFCVIA